MDVRLKAPPLDDPRALCRMLFGVHLYPYQERIFESFFTKKKRKITIRAATRAGKSYTLAMLAILKATFVKNSRIGIIAPTFDKSRYILDYIADFLSSNPRFESVIMLSVEGMTKLERMRKEVSKRRITFRNGSVIEIKSVNLNQQGFGVMGAGYSCIIVDETGEIPDSVYGKIFRMLVEQSDSQIIEIGNPWTVDSHFYEHHHADGWEKIIITWQDCVSAGRMTPEAIEEQRRELTPLEFEVLFNAEFPVQIENAVFTDEAIKNAIEMREIPPQGRIIIGADIARGGTDRTVFTVMKKCASTFYFLDSFIHSDGDIMRTSGRLASLMDTYGRDNCLATIDTVGLGAGVFDRLNEMGYPVHHFVAGAKACNDRRFFNKKTETAFLVAQMMKEKRIYNLPAHSKYVLQLRSWTFELKSDKQVKLIDPQKSPDEADSLLQCLANYVYEDNPAVIASDVPKKSSITGKPVMRPLGRGHVAKVF